MEEGRQVDFPGAYTLIANKEILIATFPPDLVMNGVQIQGPSLRNNNVGIAPNKPVGG